MDLMDLMDRRAPTVPKAPTRQDPPSSEPAFPERCHTAASGFDRLARAYRWLEYLCFGRALERCRTLQLDRIPGASSILVLGDGDGRFTSALLSRHRQSHVVALDASSAMLGLLSARARTIGASHRLRTVQGDALRLLSSPTLAGRPAGSAIHSPSTAAQPQTAPASVLRPVLQSVLQSKTGSGDAASLSQLSQQRFDGVCSHFFLDCLTTPEVEQLTRCIVPRLAPGAFWVISEFETPTWWARQIVSALYLAFALLAGLRVQRLPEWRPVIEQQGFLCVAEARLLRGLLVSSLWRYAGQVKEPPL